MNRITSDGPVGYDAFWSYVHADDRADGSRISDLANRLAEQVTLRTGAAFRIFIDGGGIGWGQAWSPTITTALRSATYFLPIVTPRYFASRQCREELTTFLELGQSLDRERLILPIYYVDVPDLDIDVRSSDPLIELVKGLQFEDWRKMVLEEPDSAVHRTAVRRLVDGLIGPVGSGPLASAPPRRAPIDEGPSKPDDGLPTSIGDVLPRLEADARRVGQLVEELDRALQEDPSSIGGEPSQATGFAKRIAAAGKLVLAVEGPTAELLDATATLLANLRTVDPEITSTIVSASLGDELWDPTATVDEVVDRLVREVDEVVADLGQSSLLVVDRMAWSTELHDVGERLPRALDHLTEACSILYGWKRLARSATDEPDRG